MDNIDITFKDPFTWLKAHQIGFYVVYVRLLFAKITVSINRKRSNVILHNELEWRYTRFNVYIVSPFHVTGQMRYIYDTEINFQMTINHIRLLMYFGMIESYFCANNHYHVMV